MNSDDEWNDARESLFAVMYYDLFQLTRSKKYLCRCYWALHASFNMMYCPENATAFKIYKTMFPFFSEEDYGFEMENAFHGEHTKEYFGEFSIFSWGAGGAVSSLQEIKNMGKRGYLELPE